MKSRFWILLFFLAISCHSPNSQTKQVLRINIQADPTTLDPRKARELTTITLMHALYEGLMRTSQDGATEPAIAKSVTISDDLKTYTFHLREAHWSNQEKVTSLDFAGSWRQMLDPAFPTDEAYQLFVIKGARAAKMGEISTADVGLQTPDPDTLIVELEHPTPYFLELLTMPAFFPVPHLKEQMETETAISNGPFLIKEWIHSDKLSLGRNPFYWDAEHVRLHGIQMLMLQPETELRMFMSREIDWAGSPLSTLPPDALSSLQQKQLLKCRPLSGTFFLRVNTKEEILSEPAVRRALALAIDRQKIAEHILQGGQLAATALVPPIMGLSTSGYFHDADARAKNLVSNVLISPITLLYIAGERSQLIAEAVQQQVAEALGMQIQLEAVERKMFYERISKKQYQLAAGSWIADFNDPINFLEVFKYSAGSTNNTGWENPKYIERLNSSAVCKDPEERRSILREAEQLLMDEMPIIPIFHFSLNYLQREGVQDVSLSPIGQIDFRWAHVE